MSLPSLSRSPSLLAGLHAPQVMNDILDFTNIRAGTFSLDPSNFSVNELLGQVNRLSGK